MVQFVLLSFSKVHFWLTDFCTGGLTLSSSTLQNDVEFIVKSMTLSPPVPKAKKETPNLQISSRRHRWSPEKPYLDCA